ncbi:MAG TPA: hypothetical protein VNX40_07700 [Mucilaginibacter sp.]|jgi:hypothetical protein|nr:hypothetical protein [Mucilaginibacter sp.]
METSIEYLKSTISKTNEHGLLGGDLMHYVTFVYAGDKPTIPLKLEIRLTFSIENISNTFLFEQKIVSEFYLSNLVSIDDMYKVHLRVVELLQGELDKTIKESYRNLFTVPIPSLANVTDSMREAILFDHLIIGFSLN